MTSPMDSRTTVVIGERISPTVYNHFPRKTATVLGTVQFCCGVAVAIICCVFFGYLVGFIVAALYVIQWIIAGSFGIAAGSKKTACTIVTNLVMSVLATLNSCLLFIVSLSLLTAIDWFERITGTRDWLSLNKLYGCAVTLLIFSLVELVTSIISAIIDCHFVCFCCRKCCCQYDVTTTDQVQFVLPQTTGFRTDDDVRLLLNVAEVAGAAQPPYYDNQQMQYPIYPQHSQYPQQTACPQYTQ